MAIDAQQCWPYANELDWVYHDTEWGAQHLREEFGSLSAYFWDWTGGKTILYLGHEKSKIPASNGLAAAIAKDLKKRGFKYVGPTNIYAHLQACGIVCAHREGCPRYSYVVNNFPTVRKRCDHETQKP